MNLSPRDMDHVIGEHHALLRHCGQIQARCSDLVQAQATTIQQLQAQVMRLRAEVIVRDTALAWAREDRAELEASIPGLPKRVVLARRVETLLARLQDVLRERFHWQQAGPAQRLAASALGRPKDVAPVDDLASLENSLVAADLVICQTGCLSHGAYWRVQDHCKRTGKTCVLVAQPDAVRIVHIHNPQTHEAAADAASSQGMGPS
ncbi:DUF2325 domain-containing protein [Rhodoferax sp. U11-2br]|uniref:DUF2325 domain-containing protein n=1 Tax=Rhodoferax sp. U11-2br TaxID=2838878 RepID=UPI001BE9BFEF|nr:DUF2325 domain-containing protein [Rhodoferax sp. U11-2br]MBT3069184.1 DUF2325 domain-containing protein [Rhodoferax sp. U11-2br]